MRKRIVAGNWKMNLDIGDGGDLIQGLSKQSFKDSTEVIIAPPFTHLLFAKQYIKGTSIKLAAQNCNENSKGAYTGEISIGMLKSIGVDYVILGHSERRELFGESNELIKNKVDAVLANDIHTIFCCGEPLEVRESGMHFKYVLGQIEDSLYHLSAKDFDKIVIAYEPIWAIGTGKTASKEQAQEMHLEIRNHLKKEYGEMVASKIQILYGGSVKPNNAADIFAQNDVDGGLIGGASLKVNDFTGIINA